MTESIRDRLEQQVGKALLRNAIFGWESAAMVGGAVAASALLPNAIPWIPWFAWTILGVVGEVAVIVARLTDKAEQQKALEGLFHERYAQPRISPSRENDDLRRKWSEAEEYRKRIQVVVDQHHEGPLRDRLRRTTDQVYDWVAGIAALIDQIDKYRTDPLIPRDSKESDKSIQDLEKRLLAARDPRTQEQIRETLESRRQQSEAMNQIKARMDRAELQLDRSLAALGTVYSQILLIGTNDVDSDRADRLRDDISGEVLALKDIVDSLNEVYNSNSTELSPEQTQAARRLQSDRASK